MGNYPGEAAGAIVADGLRSVEQREINTIVLRRLRDNVSCGLPKLSTDVFLQPPHTQDAIFNTRFMYMEKERVWVFMAPKHLPLGFTEKWLETDEETAVTEEHDINCVKWSLNNQPLSVEFRLSQYFVEGVLEGVYWLHYRLSTPL